MAVRSGAVSAMRTRVTSSRYSGSASIRMPWMMPKLPKLTRAALKSASLRTSVAPSPLMIKSENTG